MNFFSSFALFVSIVTWEMSTSVYATQYPTMYSVTKRCDQNIIVLGDIRIKLASSTYLAPNLQCSMVIEPSTSGTQLKVTFLRYSMNPAYTNEIGDCPYESIQLYDSNGDSQLSINEEHYCSKLRPSSSFYIDNFGSFQVNSGDYNNIFTAEVDVLISEVTPKNRFFNSTCPVTQFDCGNNYCVPTEVTCNGFDDCGNNADEKSCSPSIPHVVIGAIGVCIAFILIVVVFIYFLMCKHKRRSGYAHV